MSHNQPLSNPFGNTGGGDDFDDFEKELMASPPQKPEPTPVAAVQARGLAPPTTMGGGYQPQPHGMGPSGGGGAGPSRDVFEEFFECGFMGLGKPLEDMAL